MITIKRDRVKLFFRTKSSPIVVWGSGGGGGAGYCQLRVSPSQRRLVLHFQYQAGALTTTELVHPLFHHILIHTTILYHHT
jgi:hypothetical protein